MKIFYAFLLILVAGCATQSGRPTEDDVVFSQTSYSGGRGQVSGDTNWKELIREGKVFGIDFSSGYFSVVHTGGYRSCATRQIDYLGIKEFHRSTFCSVADGLVTSFNWIDETISPDDDMTIYAQGVSNRHLSIERPNADRIAIKKLEETGNISYFKVTVGDFNSYVGNIVIENITTKKIDVKVIIRVVGLNRELVEERIKEISSRIKNT